MSIQKLDFYSIRLRKKSKTETFISFESLNFIEVFEQFIESFKSDLTINEIAKKTFQFESSKLKKIDLSLSGIIKSGEFGKFSEVYNVLTKTEEKPISDFDSVINPFYFLIHIPESSDAGFLVLQSYGVSGIMSIFANYFKRFLSKNFDIIAEFSPLASKATLLKMINNGNINEITLRKYAVPSDIAEAYYRTGVQAGKKITAEFKLHAGGPFNNLFKDKIKSYIEYPNTLFFDLPALENLGFDDETETVIRVDHNGRTRSIVLNHLDRFKSSFDITNDVTLGDNKHPKFSSIDKIARELLEEHFNTRLE